MSKKSGAANSWEAENVKNTTRLKFWSMGWVLSMVLAQFGPKFLWDFETGLTILGVIINLAVGFGMILATKRHLQSQDEMQQKIFRDAAVLSLGVGLVCGLGYEMLEDIKLISFEPEISHLVILMCLTFMAGMFKGSRQYR